MLGGRDHRIRRIICPRVQLPPFPPWINSVNLEAVVVVAAEAAVSAGQASPLALLVGALSKLLIPAYHPRPHLVSLPRLFRVQAPYPWQHPSLKSRDSKTLISHPQVVLSLSIQTVVVFSPMTTDHLAQAPVQLLRATPLPSRQLRNQPRHHQHTWNRFRSETRLKFYVCSIPYPIITLTPGRKIVYTFRSGNDEEKGIIRSRSFPFQGQIDSFLFLLFRVFTYNHLLKSLFFCFYTC